MKQCIYNFVTFSYFLLLNTVCYADSDRMKPYPAPEWGISKRIVINLPLLVDEDAHKLELIIGKTIKVDCNHHWFGGQLTEEVAKGWGYTYFILKSVQGLASTLMACPPEMKDQETFVQLRGNGVRNNVSSIENYQNWNCKKGEEGTITQI